MAEKTKEVEETTFTPTRIDPKKAKEAIKKLLSYPPRILPEEGPEIPKPRFFKGACRVCGGDITEKIVKKYNPRTGPPIIGPGSRHQYYYVSEGFHCKQCGVKYEFVPIEKQGEEEKKNSK